MIDDMKKQYKREMSKAGGRSNGSYPEGGGRECVVPVPCSVM